MRRSGMLLCLLTVIFCSQPAAALADYPYSRYPLHPPGHPLWHSGYWHHGWHGGHLGWWWVVNGVWYWYPSAAYPYPRYVSQLVIPQGEPPAVPVEPAEPAPPPPAPAADAVPDAAADAAVEPPAPAEQNWYYCEESQSYYPYVSTCPGGWKTVPAGPPPANP